MHSGVPPQWRNFWPQALEWMLVTGIARILCGFMVPFSDILSLVVGLVLDSKCCIRLLAEMALLQTYASGHQKPLIALNDVPLQGLL